MKKLAIEVDDQGFTRVVEGKPANATVAMHTDPAEFFEFYMNRLVGRGHLELGAGDGE